MGKPSGLATIFTLCLLAGLFSPLGSAVQEAFEPRTPETGRRGYPDTEPISATDPEVPAGIFFVDPGGLDTNDGSKKHPFRTIRRAQLAVREFLPTPGRSMVRDVIVYIEPGTYFLGETLKFGPEDSGRNGHRVIYRGIPGKPRPLLLGAVGAGKISGDWEKIRLPRTDKTVYRIRIPRDPGPGSEWPERMFRTLYAGQAGEDGEIIDVHRLTLARYPDEGYLRATGGTEDCRGFYYPHGDLPALGKGIQKARILIWATPDVCELGRKFSPPAIMDVIDQDAKQGRISFSEARHVHEKAPYYLLGSREFLNRPGEWFLEMEEDQSKGSKGSKWLYVIPDQFEGLMENVRIIAPSVDRIIEIKGRKKSQDEKEVFVRNLRFESLEVLVSDWVDRGPGEVWDNYQSENPKAGIFFQYASDIEVEDCRIHDTGSDAILVRNPARRIRIHGSLIENSGFMGIAFWGESGSDSLRSNRISNNIIRNCGELFPWGGGILLNNCGDTLIENNDIHDMPRYGVYVRDPGSEGFVIKNNDIHHVLMGSGDAGAIGIWGTGELGKPKTSGKNLISNNLIHDIHSTLDWPVSGLGAFGIYLDKHSKGVEVSQNVIFGISSAGKVRTHGIILKGMDNVLNNNIVEFRTAMNYGSAVFSRISMDLLVLDGWNNQIEKNIFLFPDAGEPEVLRLDIYSGSVSHPMFGDCFRTCLSWWFDSCEISALENGEKFPILRIENNLILHFGNADSGPADFKFFLYPDFCSGAWRRWMESAFLEKSNVQIDLSTLEPTEKEIFLLTGSSKFHSLISFDAIQIDRIGPKENRFHSD